MDINFYKDYYSRLTPSGLEVSKEGNRIVIDGFDNEFKKGGNVETWRNKYNKKYGYSKNASHDLDEISKDTGVSVKGLQQIYNKGVGAYKTNPSSVRPNVKSKEQWGMGRVYSAVMGGKASKVDSKELKMNKGGKVNSNTLKLIEELKKHSNHSVSDVMTNEDGEKYRFHHWKLKYPSASNWLVNLFMKASKEQTGKDYHKNFYYDDVSFYYDRPEMKNKPNGTMQMRELEVLSNPDIRFEKGGLIAPNGKPSNLNPQQYKLVRTKAFKDWFGDWENDPKNSSKVIDENGEPLVCRHYSQKPIMFNEFTKQKANNTRNFISKAKEGFYFTSTDEKSIETIYNRSKKGLLYEVFLNVKNILDLGKYDAYDFKTRKAVNWKGFTYEMLQKYVIKDRIGSFDDYTEYNANVDAFWIEEIDEKTKNKIMKLGYNGVWGDKNKYADSISDEFYGTDQIVVFNSNQIKLADGTNTTFIGSNPDIRFKDGGQTPSQQRKVAKVMGEYKRGKLKSSSGDKVTNRKQAIAIALSEADIKRKLAEGGKITQYEVEAMQEYIKDPNSNPKMVKSFTQVLNKFGANVDTDSKRYDVGKYVDTYDFQGYEYMEEQNQKMGVSFLLTGEYKLVSKAIYERDYSMWLYYNYLGRISISFEDMQNWLNQAIEHFSYTLPIDILLKHTPHAKDGRSYCMVYAGTKSQVLANIGEMPTFEYEDRWYYTEIGMVGIGDSKNGGWGDFYKERKTGLTIPEYQKTAFHFNTLIHEFAHALDFQKQFLSNIEKRDERKRKIQSGEIESVELTEMEKTLYGDSFKNKNEGVVEFPIVNHFDYFIDSLIEILRASASGKIPLSYVFEQQALQVQTALSGVYGDLLLAQRERKRKEALALKRDDEMRDNKRFTWQDKEVIDVKNYVLSNAMQDGLKDALKSKSRPFTLTEIIEYDNLINTYVEDVFKQYMIENPSKAKSLLDSLKQLKKETNRIINNHYDNIINRFAYGFRPETDLDKYLLVNCKGKLNNYKNWKECSKETLSNKFS